MARDGSFLDVDSANGLFRVHRDAYRSPEVFEKEMKQVFERCWLFLGHISEVENVGDFITRRIAGRDIILVNSRKAGVGAFYNSCTHRGTTICREKFGSTKVFSCPYHGWVFSTAGELMNSDAQGYPKSFNAGGRYNLRPVERLEEYRGFYFINFNPNAVDLPTYLADTKEILDLIVDTAPSGLTVIGTPHEYKVPANYKLLAENSFDGYHGDVTHVSYFEFMSERLRSSGGADLLDGYMQDYAGNGIGKGLGNGHGYFECWIPNGRPVASWIPPWGPEAKAEIDRLRAELAVLHGEERMKRICDNQKNVVIFPNLVINDHVSITFRMFQPEAVDRMRVMAWAVGPKEEHPLLRKLRLDNFLTFLGPAGFAAPDDNEMLTLAQNGCNHTPLEWTDMSRGLVGGEDDDGRLTAGGPWTDEAQLRAYWWQWERIMNGQKRSKPHPWPNLSTRRNEAMSIDFNTSFDDLMRTRFAVEDFLYHECELLDRWQHNEWYGLFTPDGMYEITSPAMRDADTASADTELFLVSDDMERLSQRLLRLSKKTAHVEFPRSTLNHVISNVRIVKIEEPLVEARATFIVHRSKGDETVSFVGHTLYTLMRHEGGFRIKNKRCVLDIDSLAIQGKLAIMI